MSIVSPTPARLYLMQLGSADMPLGEGRLLPMVVVCYLVAMSDGTHILIDSGLPEGAELPPQAIVTSERRSVIQQLADLGLTPDDINLVICTHFDRDHAGYHDSFKKAEFIVQRQHYETARSGHPRFAHIRDHWDHPDLNYRMVEGDTELFPGLSLIETSGHAPGHQSVLVKLPNTGAVLLVIDAVAQGVQFTPDRTAGPVDDNLELLQASTQKLIDLAKTENAALVVFGHDGSQWKTLKKSPDFYD